MDTILVVEDDEVHREALARTLRRGGFAVLSASGVAQASATMRNRLPAGAVIDLRLGDGDGLEVVRMLSVRAPACRILVLTGFGSIPAAVEAVKCGAVDFLTKPTSPEVIVQALTKALASPTPATQLEDVEREHIRKALEGTDGNISHAARRLGLHRRTLQRKLQRLDGSTTESSETEDEATDEDLEAR